MKIIIFVLALVLSTSLFAQEQGKNANFEAGVMFGYISSSGLFLKYNINDNLSLRGAGYIFKSSKTFSYNSKLSISYDLHNSEFGEFYLISSGGILKFQEEFDEREKENIYFISAGLGYKYKTQRGLDFFVELEENIFWGIDKKLSFLLVPVPVVGISVDF